MRPDLPPSADAGSSPEGPGAPGLSPSARSAARRALAGLGALVALTLAVVAVVALTSSDPEPRELRFVVPQGTAERLRAGEDVDVLPGRLELRTVDSLIIENRDDEAFTFGAFRVRPGEVFSHRFSRPGTYGEVCTLHPSGVVEVVVT